MFIFKWIRHLYDKTLELSKKPNAKWWLAFISFVESSFFPIPPDVLLLPMCLADRKKAFHLAGICTLASILGGLLGYFIGAFAFESVGEPILAFYGAQDKYETFKQWYDSYGGLMVFVAGMTPIPYKVITISSGLFGFSLPQFMILSLLSRGLRFGLVALIIRIFGEPAMAIIDKHFNKLTVLGTILLVGGFIVVKLFISH